MYIYKCLIESAGLAGWTVRVPALPGVVAIGATQIKAVEAAAAAIESHFERLSDGKKPIPLEAESDLREFFVAVDPLLAPERAKPGEAWSVGRSRGRSQRRSTGQSETNWESTNESYDGHWSDSE